MKNLAIIPARSGSKGLPDKNIMDLCGNPLMYYTIKAAVDSKCFDEVMVSTDSETYADIARALGVYDRNATQRENAENAIKEVKRIRSAVGAPDSLRKYLPAELPSEDYVADVIFRTCGHITCNPAPVDKEVYKKFYREAL